jgi:multidrug efflux pump subunit AcrA (membrane-fusion protein)
MCKFYRRSVLFLVSLVLLGAMLAGCRLGRRAEPPPMPADLSQRFAASAVVEPLSTVAVKRGEVVQQMLYSGQVVPARQENLFFRRAGQVSHVYIKDGDTVQQGDLIAELDSSTLELDLEGALLSLDIANEELATAQTELDYSRRQAEINLAMAELDQKAAADGASEDPATYGPIDAQRQQYEIELAQMELAQVDEAISPILQLNVRRAELAVKKLKDAILEGQIYAPFAGEVRFINLPENEEQLTVQGYAGVARLVEPDNFEIELNLPFAQLEPLREGMPVQISAASLPGERLPGVIKAMPHPFGTSPGSLTEVALVNPKDQAKLVEGITAAVSIAIKSNQNALIIPRMALHQEDQTYYVFVQAGDAVERVDVAVGILGTEWAEIVAGLTEGQQVAVSGVQ